MLGPGSAEAQSCANGFEPDPAALERAACSALGANLGASAGLWLPPEGGPLAVGTSAEVTYGLPVNDVAISAGLRLLLNGPHELLTFAALGVVRIELPRELLSPSLFAGLGPARGDSGADLAYQIGVGFMHVFSASFAIGAEATYLALQRGETRSLFFGPAMRVRL